MKNNIDDSENDFKDEAGLFKEDPYAMVSYQERDQKTSQEIFQDNVKKHINGLGLETFDIFGDTYLKAPSVSTVMKIYRLCKDTVLPLLQGLALQDIPKDEKKEHPLHIKKITPTPFF